uniref:Golgin subfamily A conserved domain-containing protein n=1 Tax=Mola mola TaxID=94237 RepID=A0A3Q4A8L7_MOLML
MSFEFASGNIRGNALIVYLLFSCAAQLKEFQQKSSPLNVGGEKGGGGGGGVGAKKKRKVKGPSQHDVSSTDRSSPENVSRRLFPFVCLPLSSTESLRQLSQQLNVFTPPLTCSLFDFVTALYHSIFFLRNQELAAALESSNLTNSQLNTKLDQLVRSCACMRICVIGEAYFQPSLKKLHICLSSLKVHIQTIGILVSEKSELQTALQYTQQAARQKTGEAEELNNRLQSTKQRVTELERTLSSVSTQQKQFEKHNKELEKERDNLRLEMFRINNLSEESKQQNSELLEQLKLRTEENGAMRLEVDDLRKRLELADLMLQQCSSQSDPTSANQQVQLLLEEKQQLETHNQQLLESFAKLQTERDCYAEQIQEEGRVWKDKTEQLLTQIRHEVYADTTLALLSQEREAQNNAEPQSSGPSESEVALQEALNTLKQEKDTVTAQYQAQLRDNEQLSRLCTEQETRLEELERQVEHQVQEEEDRRRMLEDVQSDKATISRALTQNRTLKDQLAELQNGFVKTNENMELTNAIQSEQHVKKELARRMGELQEELHNIREQGLLEQRDQVVAHLQQYSAGYQALASEREQLHYQYLQQVQLMDRLQHEETQGRVQLEISHSQLKQEQLELLVKDNEQLKFEVRELLNSSTLASSSRDQGDGVESQSLQESPTSSSIVIPEDFESQKEMEEFIRGALAQLEVERDEARRQLTEEHRLHMEARHQTAVALSLEQQNHSHKPVHNHPDHSQNEHSHWGVPVEVHQALQAAMEKLQQRFTSLMQEKADLRERIEELEHRCIQLSGETDTIGEYIALYQSQRAIMKQKHHEKEQYISMLAQDKEEMKAKLAELQDLVMRLVAERNDWYSRYTGAVAGTGMANPDLLPVGQDPMEVIPLSEPTTGLEALSSQTYSTGSPQADTKSLGPKEDGTAQQIMQLLQEIQNPQGTPRSPPFLGENPCIPFFYRPDEQDEVKILVV